MSKRLVSIVVPAFNEEKSIKPFYKDLIAHLDDGYNYEIIFVDDGSIDSTLKKIKELNAKDKRVRLVSFVRNFGKEIALTAGIEAARGDAIISIDVDGQHPIELFHEFINEWDKSGRKVVVGVRKSNKNEGLVKKYGSKVFYKIFNSFSKKQLVPGATDYRLIDRQVQATFMRLQETNRITRGLIDWLGYDPTYIYFDAKPRMHGEATYGVRKLFGLAINSYVSLSFAPLFIMGYLGLAITFLSFLLGIFVLIEQYILGDPLHLNVSGSASLGILIVFLVGIILVGQGLVSLYISHIYSEIKRRPLYIVDYEESIL